MRILMLAGMTECGKSTAGVFLGSKPNAKRVKFVQVVRHPELQKNPTLNPYESTRTMPPQEMAERFCKYWHMFLEPGKTLYVVESVLNLEMVDYIRVHMREMDPKVIYIDTPRHIRIENQIRIQKSGGIDWTVSEAIQEIDRKDGKKMSHGLGALHEALMVSTPPNYIIHNNGSLAEYLAQLDKVYQCTLT